MGGNRFLLRTYSIILLLLISFSFSCKKDEQDEIPYVYVNFSIDPSSIEYGDLNIPGNYAYVTGGYHGIIIYHRTQNDYVAYERACTHDPLEDCARVEVDESNTLAECPCCGSRFLLLDGSPFDGPAILSLKEYRTNFDGKYLYVSN